MVLSSTKAELNVNVNEKMNRCKKFGQLTNLMGRLPLKEDNMRKS
jgi:hypothetical protein